jgi:hypothetical protein
MVVEKTFRRLDHPERLPQVALGARYRNGERVIDQEDTEAIGREAAA